MLGSVSRANPELISDMNRQGADVVRVPIKSVNDVKNLAEISHETPLLFSPTSMKIAKDVLKNIDNGGAIELVDFDNSVLKQAARCEAEILLSAWEQSLDQLVQLVKRIEALGVSPHRLSMMVPVQAVRRACMLGIPVAAKVRSSTSMGARVASLSRAIYDGARLLDVDDIRVTRKVIDTTTALLRPEEWQTV